MKSVLLWWTPSLNDRSKLKGEVDEVHEFDLAETPTVSVKTKFSWHCPFNLVVSAPFYLHLITSTLWKDSIYFLPKPKLIPLSLPAHSFLLLNLLHLIFLLFPFYNFICLYTLHLMRVKSRNLTDLPLPPAFCLHCCQIADFTAIFLKIGKTKLKIC